MEEKEKEGSLISGLLATEGAQYMNLPDLNNVCGVGEHVELWTTEYCTGSPKQKSEKRRRRETKSQACDHLTFHKNLPMREHAAFPKHDT